MTEAQRLFAQLRDPRLAPHLVSALPAWLWAADGSGVLWANAAGAVALGATTPTELLGRRFAAADPPAAVIRRLATTLPRSGDARLERLRGFGGAIGRPLACACSRLTRDDGAATILIVAAEPAGRPLRLAERVRPILAGCEAPVAVYSADGELIHATAAATRRLAGTTSLAAIGATLLAGSALDAGPVTADSAVGRLRVERLGSGADTVLLAAWSETAEVEPASPGRIAPPTTNHEAMATEPSEPADHPVQDLHSQDLNSQDLHLPVAGLLPDHGPAADARGDPTAPGGPATTGHSVAAPPETRPLLTVVPAAKNVVPFRSGSASDKRPVLTPVERPALREIGKTTDADPAGDDGGPVARTLPAIEHLGGAPTAAGAAAITPMAAASDRRVTPRVIEPDFYAIAIPSAYAPRIERPDPEEFTVEPDDRREIVDRLPVAVLVFRTDRLIYASRALFDWTGWADITEIAAAGGLDILFAERARALHETADGRERTLALALRHGNPLAVDARLFTVVWDGEAALALILARSAGGGHAAPSPTPHRTDGEIAELEAILAIATDGVVRVERDGRIISLDRGAEALFGYDSEDLEGHPFSDLLAPESHRAALDYLDALSLGGGAGVAEGGCEVAGRGLHGGRIPLLMTMGRIDEGNARFCAVFRDITRWKRAEQDLIVARRRAETASSAKSDFLAKISHEIRTPLNAIIGFSEMMMEERFGPIGNDRYRTYLKDIHASGGHLVSLINDLLDLSKIEAGKVDLERATVDLNALTKQCVALMQPQANRERIIIRTSLSPNLPPIVSDARSVRQIVLNLLSNSIKFTGAGGQVIVATALGDRGGAILRVRDTGVGMSDQEIATALEPFRQLATSTRWGSGGTGLGLPLTKALAEANGARFTIKSAVNAGTLVEITFPATRAPTG